MEDAYIVSPNLEKQLKVPDQTSIFAVFDGHSGRTVSTYCSKHFVKTLTDFDYFKEGLYTEALIESFHMIDEQLADPKNREELDQISRWPLPSHREIDEKEKASAEALHSLFKTYGENSKKEPEDKVTGSRYKDYFLPTEAGTTACVALIIGRKLYVANAGDSFAVLSRNKETLPMSYDHKPEQERETSRIEKAGGYVLGGRVCRNLNLSRGIGDLNYKRGGEFSRENQIITAEPDVRVIDLTEEDNFLVLATDGVSEVMNNYETAEFVSKHLVDFSNNWLRKDKIVVHRTVKEMFTHCLSDTPNIYGGKGSSDNMTAVVVCLRPLNDIVKTFKA